MKPGIDPSTAAYIFSVGVIVAGLVCTALFLLLNHRAVKSAERWGLRQGFKMGRRDERAEYEQLMRELDWMSDERTAPVEKGAKADVHHIAEPYTLQQVRLARTTRYSLAVIGRVFEQIQDDTRAEAFLRGCHTQGLDPIVTLTAIETARIFTPDGPIVVRPTATA